ncbi:cytochrome c biogenesis CcdA family protein [Trueperella pecoris]|uniref:cytochrome c biogenesis CcdA family protein n=1 Tax=Trueperella pecoris TaxID=2733571 RepID=UPI0018D2941E|nr:cytochrome c biogenesis CcdA family protein [Trueperella pecoris]
MIDIGFVTAFLGGALALLSPCAALLLPAYFASTMGVPRLVGNTIVFYLGLLLVLVPLGVGAGAFGSLFVLHRTAFIAGSSILLIALGLAQIFGFGFDAAKIVPGHSRMEVEQKAATGLFKTFLLGTTSGLAGFCAGPILGAVLTMAAASGDVLTAGLLLAAYGAGMVVPLLIIAALWRPLGRRGRAFLRGRTFSAFGRDFHTTSVVSGLLVIGIGVLFWATNGLVGVPELIPLSTQAGLQLAALRLANVWVDVVGVVLAAAIVLVLWARKSRDAVGPATPEAGGMPERASRGAEQRAVGTPGFDAIGAYQQRRNFIGPDVRKEGTP